MGSVEFVQKLEWLMSRALLPREGSWSKGKNRKYSVLSLEIQLLVRLQIHQRVLMRNDRNFLFEGRPPRTKVASSEPQVAAVPKPQAATAGNTPVVGLFFGQTISGMSLLCQPEPGRKIRLDIYPGLQ